MNVSDLPKPVQLALTKLVPASVINNISCFVFYDKHPNDDKKIDIILCTGMGEVLEYYERTLVSSITLPNNAKPTSIKILRNSNCDLFYLVVTKERITILSGKDELVVHKVVDNVDKYDIDDGSCSGQACLRVFRKGDAVPHIFDDNFEQFKRPDISVTVSEAENDETVPIIAHLMRKLTEAKYSVQHSERTYKELLDLHQKVAFESYKKIHPNLQNSVFKNGPEKIASALRIKTKTPWIKVCNQKIVIVIEVTNLNKEDLEDVHILIHGTTGQSIEYTTKLFEETAIITNNLPFWTEIQTQTLKPNVSSAIILIMDTKEIIDSLMSKLNLNAVIFYKRKGQEYLLPVREIELYAKDTIGAKFDAISSTPIDSKTMLAILATTEKTDLLLRHIMRSSETALSLDILCQHLMMERLDHYNNIIIHRSSPYHTLNGVMILMHSEQTDVNDYTTLSVYSRTQSQVLALIHCIHDAVPLTLVITTPDQKLKAKHDDLAKFNEDSIECTQKLYNYHNYAATILKRTKLALKYLDDTMVKMGESKNPLVQTKIGCEIDLFAAGQGRYMEFKDKMRKEAALGVKSLYEDERGESGDSDDDVMCID
uniref:SFRICE_010295 n=1 Tax=Spodoptera frugiperda TaxID=7108 RepID=A0A2H1VZ46_SPOFR